jgi:hypothetical protein
MTRSIRGQIVVFVLATSLVLPFGAPDAASAAPRHGGRHYAGHAKGDMAAGRMATVAATAMEAMLARRPLPASSGASSPEPWPPVSPPEDNAAGLMPRRIAGWRTAALGMAINGLCNRSKSAPDKADPLGKPWTA